MLRKDIGVDEVATQEGPAHYRHALSWFTALVNSLGVPALSVPLATKGDPPPSVQLIAPWWAEETLIAVGRRLEREGLVHDRLPTDPWWWA